MRRTSIVAVFGLLAVTLLLPEPAPAQTSALTGQVTSAKEGAMEGVVVSAKKLGSTVTISVATDDQGRFMVPELPNASYNVWVRGYGLVDSTPIQMKPGTNQVSLTAALAKTPQEAAKV